jgi:hypothetical protein
MAQDRRRNIQLESENENQRQTIEELEAQVEEMRVNQANVELGLLRLGIGGFSQIWDFISGGKHNRHPERSERISSSGIKSTGLRKPHSSQAAAPSHKKQGQRKSSLPVTRQDSAHIMSM